MLQSSCGRALIAVVEPIRLRGGGAAGLTVLVWLAVMRNSLKVNCIPLCDVVSLSITIAR